MTPISGGIASYAAAENQTLYVYVTGDTTGTAYGTGPYALNSDIGAAAVQSGKLTSGQSAVIQVNILPDLGNYPGGAANGVTSSSEGASIGSFQIVGIAPSSAYTFGPVDAGSTPVTATIVDFDYAGTASGTLVISPATLTYTAVAVSQAYGTPIPALTGTVTGFVTGDTLANATAGTLAFTTSATQTSPVGSYAINGGGRPQTMEIMSSSRPLRTRRP